MVIMNKVRMCSAHYQRHVFLHSQPWMCACCADRCGSVGTLVCMSACFYSLFMHHLQIIFWRWSKRTVQDIKRTKMSKKKLTKSQASKSMTQYFFPGSIQLNLSIPCELCLLLYFVVPWFIQATFFLFKLKAFTMKFRADMSISRVLLLPSCCTLGFLRGFAKICVFAFKMSAALLWFYRQAVSISNWNQLLWR